MAIVCGDEKTARNLSLFSENLHAELLANKTIPPLDRLGQIQLGEASILGLLTLEDVIERILRVDIVDENERDQAVAALQQSRL